MHMIVRVYLSISEDLSCVADCVVNHEELAIRVCCPRWRTISLHNISASVCAMVDGRTVPLKLLHGISTWPLWVGGAIPMTLRHGDRTKSLRRNSTMLRTVEWNYIQIILHTHACARARTLEEKPLRMHSVNPKPFCICMYTDVRDLESPFNPKSKFGGYDRVMSVVVHVRAEDQHGNPISHSYQV